MADDALNRKDSISGDEAVPCRPFLKWVGGKGQLLPQIIARFPKKFDRYFEPFVGGGAVFFRLQPARSILSDLNPDLINVYKVIRDDVQSLIQDLKQHKYEKEYFYRIRNVDRGELFQKWSPVRRASRLIYLNKSCFNGLYRVNSKGEFNVPFGRYTNPTIVDVENLQACSKALQGVELLVRGFNEIEDGLTSSDFVYFDPPYVPLSASSSFANYVKGGFDREMQIQLFEMCVRLDKRNIPFMLSNSSAPFVTALYQRFNVQLVSASRAINAKGSGRGKINEVLVTNY